MIPIPKPKFVGRKFLDGQSKKVNLIEITDRQTHSLRDAINRVSSPIQLNARGSEIVFLIFLSSLVRRKLGMVVAQTNPGFLILRRGPVPEN